MAEKVLLVVSTWPDVDNARRAGRILVEEQLAACANVVPQMESIYRWEGRIETAHEVLMVIKTTVARYPALETRITHLHPYQGPEILAFPSQTGLAAYCQWVFDSCAPVAPPEKGH
jgi:periplasmic divalent cation tolerance protein